MPDELADLVRAADVVGLRVPQWEQDIIDHDGSLDAYRRYLRRAAWRLAGAYLALIAAVVAGIYGWWTWYDWGPWLVGSIR
jgi:hypothetical protein